MLTSPIRLALLPRKLANGDFSDFSFLREHDLHFDFIHRSRVTYHIHIFQVFIFSCLHNTSIAILSESPMGFPGARM